MERTTQMKTKQESEGKHGKETDKECSVVRHRPSNKRTQESAGEPMARVPKVAHETILCGTRRTLTIKQICVKIFYIYYLFYILFYLPFTRYRTIGHLKMSEYIFLMIWSWCLSLMKAYDLIYELFSNIILLLDGEKVQNGIRYTLCIQCMYMRGFEGDIAAVCHRADICTKKFYKSLAQSQKTKTFRRSKWKGT